MLNLEGEGILRVLGYPGKELPFPDPEIHSSKDIGLGHLQICSHL